MNKFWYINFIIVTISLFILASCKKEEQETNNNGTTTVDLLKVKPRIDSISTNKISPYGEKIIVYGRYLHNSTLFKIVPDLTYLTTYGKYDTLEVSCANCESNKGELWISSGNWRYASAKLFATNAENTTEYSGKLYFTDKIRLMTPVLKYGGDLVLSSTIDTMRINGNKILPYYWDSYKYYYIADYISKGTFTIDVKVPSNPSPPSDFPFVDLSGNNFTFTVTDPTYTFSSNSLAVGASLKITVDNINTKNRYKIKIGTTIINYTATAYQKDQSKYNAGSFSITVPNLTPGNYPVEVYTVLKNNLEVQMIDNNNLNSLTIVP